MINNSGEPKFLIIPAAGLGTRMKEVNHDLPKEMLPIGNKPAIQYAVEEGIAAGIKDIIVVINRQKEVMRDFLEAQYRGSTSISLTFLYQEKPLGESDAIGYAKDIVGNHAVAIIHPDDIYFPASMALRELIKLYIQYKTDVIALKEVIEEYAVGFSNSGRVDVTLLNDNVYRIDKFIQKSKGTYVPRFNRELRSYGFSISGPHIFEVIERLRSTVNDREYTNFPVHRMILKEKGFIGCHLGGIFFDIANPKGYELCLNYMKDNPNLK